MTHAEKLSGKLAPGLPPSACPGEVTLQGLVPDHVLDEGGTLRQRAVALYHCDACGAVISEADGVVLNAYHKPPPVKDVVRRLAGEIGARKERFLP